MRTRDEIIEAARRAAQEHGGIISRSDFERITGINQYHIYRLFPEGGWGEVKQLAGIKRHPKDNESVSDEKILKEFHNVTKSLGKIPTWSLFSSTASISADVVRRRFGGLQGTLKQYRVWLETHDPNSPILDMLQIKSKHEIPPPPTPLPQDAARPAAIAEWAKSDGPEFGPPINFRGLRHAPINEQGVVFLFGMVSYELGFIVEAVHASYPDCEAKRCIDRRRDRWQRVRIEFEFRSSHFRDHGHDQRNCDLIVCWEHNWAECPVEVIELRKIIDSLDG
jgi:hypothetical protein